MNSVTRSFLAVAVALLLFAPCAMSVEAPPLDPKLGRMEDRQQLRVLLEQLEKAISDLDIDGVLKIMTPDAVVTWQNAEVSRGQEQIRTYHNRMVKGGAPVVTKFSTKATLGGPAVFYNDTAVAYGTTVDSYELAEGLKFVLNANWSATIVKQDGQWKAAAIHFSTNLFDNPLLHKAEQMIWVGGIAGLLAGLLLAFLLGRLLRKK